MERLTYKQAFDLITVAYIKDEIKPYDGNFCFCGTLSGGVNGENWQTDECPIRYTKVDYFTMERALLTPLCQLIGRDDIYLLPCNGNEDFPLRHKVESHTKYEETLFNGMCRALEVLKTIHIERGETIDDTPSFQKRKLQPTN